MDGIKSSDVSNSFGRTFRGSLRFCGGFFRYSAYATLYGLLAVGIVAAVFSQPSIKSRAKETVKKYAQRYFGSALATSQGFQDREALKQQLDELQRTISLQLREIKQGGSATSSVAASAPVGPSSASSTPLPGSPAAVRPLPYPFHSYLTIESDPDSMKFVDFERIHELLHDKFQLNLSDQVFVSNSSGNKPQSGLDLKLDGKQPEPNDLDRFHRLLIAYRHGLVEGIHGWHSMAFASNEAAFRLDVKNGSISHKVSFSGLNYYDSQDHSYIVFEYRQPIAGSACTVKVGDKALSVLSQADQSPGMECVLAWTPVYAALPAGVADPQVEFIFSGPPESYLEVRNLMVTNFPAARVAAEARFLQSHNLRFLCYSEHGRIRNELVTGVRYDIAKETRPIALMDNPQQSPSFYVMPYLEQLGVTFINASHHTNQYDVLPIVGVTHPHRFNDGVVRYNFKRYMSLPKRDDGRFQPPNVNISWEPWLGYHIDRLLKYSTRPGDGGIIYTHWGCGNPAETTLSEATLQEFAVLQERHYNLSGETPLWKRVWVAPTAETLLYARAVDGIADNARYDETTDTVHIRSWYDPVARQSVPWNKTRAFGLANLTFYVRDSATARLTIDGRDYTCLKRNPADQTGRQSITIVDDYVPTVVLDEVDPLHKFGDAVSDNASCYFRQTEGFRGAKCLEVQLEDSAGQSTWTLPELTTAHTNLLRFAYRKTNPASQIALRLAFEDGTELVASEAELKEQEIGWRMAHRDDKDWHDAVLALAEVQGPRPLARVPRGKLKSLTFRVTGGEAGDSAFFDAVEFLRHPIHPPSSDGHVLVAGRVEPPTDGVKMVLDDGQFKHQTTTKQGYFFFTHAARKGSIVKVFAEVADQMPRFPTTGRYLELQGNEVDLTVPLADLRDAGLSKKLQKVNKGLSEVNDQVGRIYKPHTDYAHSGIGTPQEFENHLQINNIGFLDRDRRPANPDHARRILFLGNCNLFGHSTPRSYHGNILLEDLLTRSTGYPTEVVTMADSAMSFGKHWSYYAGLGRKFQPDVVCIFVHTSGVEHLEADPDLFARFYEYAPNCFPCTLFRSQSAGGLKLIDPDPEYFQHIGKDEALHKEREQETKKGGYYTAGVDWLSIYYREDWNSLPEPARKAWDHFARVLKFYRDEMTKDGARVVIVLTPEAQRMYGGTYKDFKDSDGQACHTRLFGERMEKLCRQTGVGFLNLTPYIEQHYPDPGMYIWRHDAHPSPYGFQMLAAGVHDYLLATNFGEVLPGPDPAQAAELVEALKRGGVKR